MNILDWIRGQMASLSQEDARLARRVEAAETLLAHDDADQALRTLTVETPEDRDLLARYLYVKIRAAVRLRDLASLDGLGLHAETLAELLPEQAKYLMLEAEAIGALGLAKALAEGISLAGVGAGEDILRIQQKKVSRIMNEGCLDIARTALGREYEDIRLIGWGKTSYVVSALPKGRQHRVAVKFLGPRSYHDEKGRQRFEREAEVLRQLEHPGILQVFSFHPEEPPYMVTEFFPGADLKRLLEQGRTFFPGETARIGLQLASAVAAAHEEGVIHRNVQPANVLINYQNHVKLIDFGMARLSANSDISTTGMVLGEWFYMSSTLR